MVMGDQWDYKLRKMEMAWELASRFIPEEIQNTGKWTETDYLKNAQAALREAYAVVNAIFKEA
jgi:hypothetical protein